MFDDVIKALLEYEKMCKDTPKSYEEEYKFDCAALDIAKAFVYDLGYKKACQFAKGILALEQLHSMR